MILESVVLKIRVGQAEQFEAAFSKASRIISSMRGHLSHRLLSCIEHDHQYLLLVEWETLEDHTIGFRGSEEYQQWKELLHHFYDPFPVVDHYTPIVGSNR